MQAPPRTSRRSPGRLLLLLACLLLAAAGESRASDLYVTGILGLGPGMGDTGGSIDLGPGGLFPNSGSDVDSSPLYGTALGFEVRLDELLPHTWDVPMPEYALRVELEGVLGRDYELVTSGADPFLSRVSPWTALLNTWMDFPVHAGISRLFGRVPLLEPLGFGMGAGFGLGWTEIDTSNNVAFGKSDAFHFAWQAGAGFGYELTDRVTLALDYRYLGLGSHDLTLVDSVGAPIGSFSMDLSAHEVVLGVRVRFYTVPAPGTWGVASTR